MIKKNTKNIFAEKERIGRLSHIREIVFGFQDGLLFPLGVISSVEGAFNNNHIVIIVGISGALAGAFSMATGAYLSSQSEKQLHDAEIYKEGKSIEKNPEEEKEEIALLFEKEGISKDDCEILSNTISKYKNSFFTTMVQKELGIDPESFKTPISDAYTMGISFLIAAMIPLFPYFFLKGSIAIIISILLSFIALFCVGALKARFTLLPYVKSGFQVLFIGACSGIGGYFLGTLLPHLLGIK